MKIFYFANIRLPTEKAHGIQIMEMCKAFAALGHEVELIVPNRSTHIAEDPFVYYHIDTTFRIRRLSCLDTVSWGRVGFRIESCTFALSALVYGLLKEGMFYTRDEILGFGFKVLGKYVAWEAHMGHANFFQRMIVRLRVPIVVITTGLKTLYEKGGTHPDLIHVAPDGVQIENFDIPETRREARTALGIDPEKNIVLYTGHLFSWKGADTLAEAADYIPPGIEVLFVGGTEKDIASFRSRFGEKKNITIIGKKPHHEIPLYLRSADILVIPNSAKEDISRLYTSPMKLFEYMAVSTPIVASDLPSLREILSDTTAYFVTPDDPQSLGSILAQVCNEPKIAEQKARAAFKDVQQYSWTIRAQNILTFLNETF